MIFTGHGCTACAPISTEECGGSETVYANDIGVSHDGACIVCHTVPLMGTDDCVTHCPKVNEGSPNVFVENIPLARVYDSADGGWIVQGSPNVYANDHIDRGRGASPC
jgi:hypothetical protein